MEVQERFYYKKPACVITEAGKSHICSVGRQPRDPGELAAQTQSEGRLLDNSLLLLMQGFLFYPGLQLIR